VTVTRSRLDAEVAVRSPLPAALAHVRVLRAAARLDVGGVTDILRASIARHGVVLTWERLIRPALAHLDGRMDETDGPAVAGIVFRRTVFEALSTVCRRSIGSPRRVLLACADEEHESLPLDAVAAALAESGVGCVELGARVPPHALSGAAGRLRPAVVVIWSQTCDTADPAQLTPLLASALGPAVLAAGPGWAAVSLRSLVAQPNDVGTAVALTLALL
jgi:hypothetical protein